MLELPVGGQADGTEDFYFSGVYVESGSLTTSVAGPGGVVGSVSSVVSAAPPGKTMNTSTIATSKLTTSKTSTSKKTTSTKM